jgi:serine/threonine protein kinase
MSKIVSGQCPSCEAEGDVGTPCAERVCARQSIHFIPVAEARKALAEPTGVREPLIGQFVGDYLIIGRLGRGGFGRVLLGLQRPLYKLKSALKLIEAEPSDKGQQQRAFEKFESEANALAVLQSPHIVRMLQFGSFHGRPFLAMEYVPGSRTLQREIDMMVVRQEPLPHQLLRRLVDQILNGLEAAHREGIVHRDIKPDNIMLQDVVGDPWFVKLVDFGLARVHEGSHETSTVLGTLTYMAPEQLEARNIGPWSDLYALGVIVFELFTGVRPFSDRDTQRVISDKLDPSFDPLLSVAHRGLPTAVRSFLTRALKRSVDERFRSAQEFRAAFHNLFESLGTRDNVPVDLTALIAPQRLAELRAASSDLEPTSIIGEARSNSALPAHAQTSGVRGSRSKWLWWSMAAAVVLASFATALLVGSRPTDDKSNLEPKALAERSESATPQNRMAERSPNHDSAVAPLAPAPTPPTLSSPPSEPQLATPEPTPAPKVFVVRSRPAGATLRVDGVPHGVTPVELNALPGTRLILEFEASGYRPLRHDLEVTDETTSLEKQLEPLAPRRPPRPAQEPAMEKPASAPPSMAPVYID